MAKRGENKWFFYEIRIFLSNFAASYYIYKVRDTEEQRQMKEQIERIKAMEQQMDTASVAVIELSAALDKYQEAQEAIEVLSTYYESKEWKQDFADDEAGRLPQSLKRGVLSEDGIWNLLADNRELKDRLKEMVAKL